MAPTTFTGLQRRRGTTRRVWLADAAARVLITVGGLGTIAAVALVCLFLVWVVAPLLQGGSVAAQPPLRPQRQTSRLLHLATEPYQQVAWQLGDDGIVRAIALADARVIAERQVFEPTSCRSVRVRDNLVIIGRADGAVGWTRVAIDSQPLTGPPPAAADVALTAGRGRRDGERWLERTDDGWRSHQLRTSPGEPFALGAAPVLLADVVPLADGETLAAITADRRFHLRSFGRQVNPITDEVQTSNVGAVLELQQLGADTPPDRLLLTGAGDNAYLIWDSGRLLRVDTRDREHPRLVEELSLLAEPARITACTFLIGGNTLLVGDDRGRVQSFFLTKPPGARGRDGGQLDAAHRFDGSAAVVALASSVRSRMFAGAFADGSLRVFQASNQKLVAAASLPEGERPLALALAPKQDGLLVATATALHRFALDAGHPEFTLAAVAAKVWYEGYPEPAHVWQSTSGTDDFEPKFGLWPLVFGTIKATLYCLLFGVPLALLAAIYTSEFLHPRSRARVKPLIELMASLPSVVLGFLAALLFAPIVESALPVLFAAAACVPLVWLLGSQAVALLPQARRLQFARHRLLLVLAAVPVGLLLAVAVGALAENVLFGGSMTGWLAAHEHGAAGAQGSPFGGWLLLFLPLAALATALLLGHLRAFAGRAAGGCLRLGLGIGITLALAGLCAGLGSACGDLRGHLLGTYVQRNALVVGFVMGFAVIPIVYTIAEDALAAVPEHLRAASLGAGATPWQTAVRVILPTAMSGIFSAVMVGLGRAVGETMIVLMAAGNTPVLELSPFSGFRTLSANIAVELPEAVRDSTHYRLLYLAALVLFALTFALNTVAEVVRQRFRRRAWQL